MLEYHLGGMILDRGVMVHIFILNIFGIGLSVCVY